MGSNVILFGWTRSLPGKETTSSEHFDDFVGFMGGLQQAGTLTSFDVVFLDPHGGDLNGFFLLRGEPTKLDALVASDDWVRHVGRANLHLQGLGVIRGVTGDAVGARMETFRSLIGG